MFTSLLVSVAVIYSQPLSINDDGRLDALCTFTEAHIPATELLKRISKTTGVRLRYACSFKDPLLLMYVSKKPISDVLSAVTDCLDLDWRTSGDGYELYMPSGTADRESALRGGRKAAMAAKFRECVKQWKEFGFPKREPDIHAVRPYFDSDRSYHDQLLRALAPHIVEELVAGKVVVKSISSSNSAEMKLVIEAGNETDYYEHLAISLDYEIGKLRVRQWSQRGQRIGYSKSYSVFLQIDYGYGKRALLDAELKHGKKAEYGILEFLAHDLEGETLGRLQGVAVTETDLDKYFDVTRFDVIRFNKAQITGDLVMLAPVEGFVYARSGTPILAEDELAVSQSLGIGWSGEVNGICIWTPINYWFRDEFADTQRNLYAEGRRGNTLMSSLDLAARLGEAWSYWDLYPGSYGATNTFQFIPRPFWKLWKSLSLSQKRQMINTVDLGQLPTNQAMPALSEEKKNLSSKSLSSQQKVLMRETLTQLLSCGTISSNGLPDGWKRFLQLTDKDILSIRLKAGRQVHVYSGDLSGRHIHLGFFSSYEEWKHIAARWCCSSSAIALWRFSVEVGIEGGASLTKEFVIGLPLISLPYTEVLGGKREAYDKMLKEVNRKVF